MITFRICDLFLEALVAGNIIPISFFFFSLTPYFSRTNYLSQNRLEVHFF